MIRRRKRRLLPNQDLDITAFMNLMVILVPFLLLTAVFSRVTIVDLNIPPPTVATPSENKSKANEEPIRIDVTVRKTGIEISDNKIGLIKQFPVEAGNYDIKGLSELLQNMKDRVPEKQDATILVEPDVPYEKLIQVMDTVRAVEVVDNNVKVKVDLFPDISLGDALPKQ